MLVLGAAALYATWSNWSWRDAPPTDSPAGMVASLARKLERKPDDIEGWVMLGRSYMVLQQLPLALRAYGRADRLAEGRNVEALIGMGETLVMQDESEFVGRAGQLFDRALQIDPKSGKALFFGAVAALRRGELPVARDRFASLLALDPPENIRPLLEQQLAAIDRELGGGAGGRAAASVAGGESAKAGENEAVVRVRVTLSPKLAANVPKDAPLFVFVRSEGAGPPLAVKRLAQQFPQDVELGAGDAMIAGRGIEAGKQVQVIARVSLGGTPTASSGDPFGELRYDVGRDGPRDIVIDRITP